MKKFFAVALSLLMLLTYIPTVDAAKTIPTPKKTVVQQKKATTKKLTNVKKSTQTKKQAPKKSSQKSTGKSSGGAKIKGTDVTVSYKVQGNSLVVTFGNLKNTTSVSYTLMYTTNDQQEGAVGTIYPKGVNTASRTLLFGTCSKNVCRYHSNISSVVLEVKAKLKSRKAFSQTYTIM